MKRLKYEINNPVNKGTEENPRWEDSLFGKDIPFTEANEAIAKREAHNGQYIIEEIPTSPAEEIAELKAKLAATDYQAIKYAEGALSAEEYEPIKASRQEWRDRINELEVKE